MSLLCESAFFFSAQNSQSSTSSVPNGSMSAKSGSRSSITAGTPVYTAFLRGVLRVGCVAPPPPPRTYQCSISPHFASTSAWVAGLHHICVGHDGCGMQSSGAGSGLKVASVNLNLFGGTCSGTCGGDTAQQARRWANLLLPIDPAYHHLVGGSRLVWTLREGTGWLRLASANLVHVGAVHLWVNCVGLLRASSSLHSMYTQSRGRVGCSEADLLRVTLASAIATTVFGAAQGSVQGASMKVARCAGWVGGRPPHCKSHSFQDEPPSQYR